MHYTEQQAQAKAVFTFYAMHPPTFQTENTHFNTKTIKQTKNKVHQLPLESLISFLH